MDVKHSKCKLYANFLNVVFLLSMCLFIEGLVQVIDFFFLEGGGGGMSVGGRIVKLP